MSDFLTVVKDNALAITTLVGVFTIIGAGLGFWLNFRLSRKKLESDKKALRQQMITNNIAPMRQEWINDLRSKVATYISSTKYVLNFKHRNAPSTFNDDNPMYLYFREMARVSDEAQQYIDLVLPENANNKDPEADEIRFIMGEVDELLSTDSYEYVDVIILLDRCAQETKTLLKKEWEVTKSLKEIE
ncbi:hypothetical protein [Morganella morganii]|uniref:hypothetical protein n=1 Tax=Morganella morganii TaxID=582 RepID=UPI000468F8BA|nr:hypothetical protein [Morganella morganii]